MHYLILKKLNSRNMWVALGFDFSYVPIFSSNYYRLTYLYALFDTYALLGIELYTNECIPGPWSFYSHVFEGRCSTPESLAGPARDLVICYLFCHSTIINIYLLCLHVGMSLPYFHFVYFSMLLGAFLCNCGYFPADLSPQSTFKMLSLCWKEVEWLYNR